MRGKGLWISILVLANGCGPKTGGAAANPTRAQTLPTSDSRATVTQSEQAPAGVRQVTPASEPTPERSALLARVGQEGTVAIIRDIRQVRTEAAPFRVTFQSLPIDFDSHGVSLRPLHGGPLGTTEKLCLARFPEA
jgi:hypothetical protein